MNLLRYILTLLILMLLVTVVSLAGETKRPVDRAMRHQQQIFRPQSSESPRFETAQINLKAGDINDLLISETVSPAAFNQKSSSIARLATDRMVVVWQDDRLGSYKIFAQIYDASGAAVSSNALMIGRADGYNLLEPKAAPDGSGGFYLAWRDENSGRIYAARYNSSLAVLTSPFVFNDTLAVGYAGPYDIDSYPDGRLVAVWEQYNLNNSIVVRLFNTFGVPLTGVLIVNEDNSDVSRWVPSVAVNKTGGMAVVWEDYRNGNADIFMRLLNQDGTPNGADFGVVEAVSDDSAQYLPQVAHSPADGFAVTWLDRRYRTQKVFLQRVIPGLGLVGGNVKISEDDPEAEDWDVSLAINSTGNLVASWASMGATENIVLRKFTSGFVPDGAVVTVNSFTEKGRWEIALAIGGTDKIFCSWTDYLAINPDIYLEMLTSQGVPIYTSDKLVNDDSRGAQSAEQDLAVFHRTLAGVAFTSARRDDGDIYLQLVGIAGNLVGVNQKINTDTLAVLQNEPSLTAGTSQLLAVWNDSRAIAGVTGQRIFGRFGSLNGVLADSDFVISDAGNVSSKRGPAVAFARNQKALVAWTDYRLGTGHIMGRFVKGPGVTEGNEFQISTSGIDFDNDDVTVARDSSDIFTVVWLSRGAFGSPAAIAAHYNSSGGFIDRISFNGNMPGTKIVDIAAAVSDSGDIYLLWLGESSTRRLYLTVFSKTGAIKKSTFEVTNNANAAPLEPDIAVDNNRFATVSWIDSRSAHRAVYYQIYDPTFSAVGGNTPISSAGGIEFMASPSIATYRGRAWFSWIDPRSNGLNVYLSQVFYDPTDVNDHPWDVLPTAYLLEQNYPNPFNPSTVIEFAVPTRDRVEILVYNLLGQTVLTLVDGVYAAGHYQLLWNGRDAADQAVPSGIYLYKMKAGEYAQTRKMILIK